MGYCTLKGFLVVLVIQLSRSEGPSTSSLHSSSATAALQDGQALSQEPALPPAEVVPVVSPPSLKEVQQAVQEASEQVEGRGAEEVLKELLERVVEAAMGQVEGGSEAKGDAATVQEAVEEEDVLGAETSESEAAAEAEVLGQTAEDESVGNEGEEAGAEEKQEGKEVAASEDVVEEAKGVIEGGHEAATESVEATAAVDDGVQEAQGGEVIYEFPKPELSQDVEEAAVAFLENTEGHLAAEGESEVGAGEQVAVREEKGESEVQAEGQTPAVLEVATGGESEQEPVEESVPGLEVAGVEQTGQDLGGEELQTETVLEEPHEELAIPFDNFELEATESVEENAALNDDEDNAVGKPALEDEQVSLVDIEGEGEVGAETTVVGETAEEDSEMVEQAVVLVNEEGEQQAGEEQQTASESSSSSEKDDQELPLISGPEPEDSADVSVEQTPENAAPTPNPSLAEVETGENTLDGEDSNHGNEIITPTNDLLPHDPDEAQPTPENPVNDPPAEQPQATGEEPGEVNELVEDTPETAEANEASLEAWKIGAISAAVFLVLETVVIIIYILKCRNKNSAAARLRVCEEGCVEPEAATGGDCSDDTLPAGNGDTQQISVLDASDAASTLAKTKEQQDDHAIALSALPPGSAEESANTGLGPDSSQDLRTSVL